MKKSSLIVPALVAGIASILTSAYASADEIFVTDNGANLVQGYSSNTPGSNGTTLATAGLNGPTGLVFNSAGDLFVANNGSGTIEEYSSSGPSVFATNVGNPRGLAFVGSNLYVANQAGGDILEFNSSGVPTATPFASGLSSPNGLAVDSEGNIYVSEGGDSNTIVKISTLGVVTTFATAADGLNNPNGLAFDAAGNLYVINNGGSESIEEFNMTTPGHSTFATAGLDNAKDLAFDSAGNLYVTNAGNGTVTSYDSTGLNETLFADDLSYPCFVITAPDGTNIPNDTPEPSTYALLTAGLGALLFLSRRKAAKV